jgi:hypothetical protein
MQFTLRDVALAIFLLGAVLALGRFNQPGLGAGQKTLLTGMTFYLGGFLALWADRRSTGITLMLGGLVVVLIGAVICGGFPA